MHAKNYGHMLSIVRNKHKGNLKRLPMMNYSGLNTKNKKWIKMRMKRTMSFYGKWNEIISYYAFHIWSCPLLSGDYRSMCCCGWCTLYHILTIWIKNDINTWEWFLVISILIYLFMWKGKRWETFLWRMCVPFSKTIVAIMF